MKMVDAHNITFTYGYEGSEDHTLEDVSLTIEQGEFVVILGHNGCGKSTLAKHFNALLELQEGELVVAGISAGPKCEVWDLRRKVGMVFQNPDNQFVSSIVSEDVAFGLENYNIPREEIKLRVARALKTVGMDGFENRSVNTLSGGQKQRVALAGVLALEPDVLIFDEVTSMLDPEGRADIQQAITSINASGKTVIMITHYIEESILADRVFLMKDGKLIASGTPREILTDSELLATSNMEAPLPVRIYEELKAQGMDLGECPLIEAELVEALCR